MKEYPGKRGLILCNSYVEVSHYDDYLYVHNPEQYERLTVHRRGDSAETLLEEHTEKSNSVIISPSLWEGLSLDGDLGEFLIIAKVPYPSMNDPVIKGLSELDKNRYFEDACAKIRQGVGRIIRSEEDEADIYILDGAFRTLYRHNKKLFPENFQERVIMV